MCGIAGIFNFFGRPVESQPLQNMLQVQHHRGPDDQHYWLNTNARVGLAHNRLKIIDLSEAASQPMHYLGRYTITFNGEIYNYKALRSELQAKGHRFVSQSDTEVLLAMFAQYGKECVKYLDGMFAFAIWDEQEQKLFCARDRFGEKPFHYYFSTTQGQFIFASEMKTIFASAYVAKELNHRMVYHYLANQIVENPNEPAETFYENIYSLEQGCHMSLGLDGYLLKERYWNLADIPASKMNLAEAKDRFRSLFNESLQTRMQADVPVGISLSGGLDSSAITCGIRALLPNEEIKTFSARFKDAALDEGHHIQKVVDQTGAIAYSVVPDEITLLNDVERVLYHQEAPFSSASVIAQWEVYKLAAEAGIKVLLDGQGSDEYLAGYQHFYTSYYKQLYRTNRTQYQREANILKEQFNLDYHLSFRQKCEASLPSLFANVQGLKNKYLGSRKDSNLDQRFIRQFQDNRVVFKNYTSLKDATLDFTTHYGLHKLLRFADRNSMGHSLEVRLPFLRHQLVEFVHSLPPELLIHEGWTKFILRESMQDVMPKEITWRRDKLGFQAPQIDWLKSPKVQAIVEDGRRSLESHHILKKNAKGVSDWDIMILHLFMRQ